MTGQTSYYAGLAAEDIVARTYAELGFLETKRRWRGPGGEIDLILARDDETVFVEVKKAKDFATAAERITARQLQRIEASANGYLGMQPRGLESSARVDVALVDGIGAVEIIENVTLH
jgi:putative endonuclease